MLQKRKKPFNDAGFTIIELLVVIAIIAVLAGILFPVFFRAKQSGQRTVALTQVKQLGQGILMYVDQADNKYPPSTNYGLPDSEKAKIWTNLLLPLVKDKKIFVAPGSEGVFASKWAERSMASVGYSSATAVDREKGCDEDQKETANCIAFKTVASFDKNDSPSKIAMLALTPEGPLEKKYLGYEFSPYNGVDNPDKPEMSAPLVSDRDLVKEQPDLPAELLKPVYARYLSTGSDDGITPIIFADSHVKEFSAKAIASSDSSIIWRFR
jgi:prepilin-type N-terminal cleavage/methylation domain-containing protein